MVNQSNAVHLQLGQSESGEGIMQPDITHFVPRSRKTGDPGKKHQPLGMEEWICMLLQMQYSMTSPGSSTCVI